MPATRLRRFASSRKPDSHCTPPRRAAPERALLAAGIASVVLGLGGASAGAATAPTIYAANGATVTPIEHVSGATLPPIAGMASATSGGYMVTAPDQRTVWFAGTAGVTAIDTATNAKGATIAMTAKGIAISPDGRTLYVTDATARTVTAIDTATQAVGTPISLGSATPSDSSVVVSPDNETVYVGTSTGVLKVDPIARTVGAPMITGRPAFGLGDLVFSPDGSTLFVGMADGLFPIDVAAGTVGPKIALNTDANSARPGMALSPDGATLWVVNTRYVVPVDVATKTAGAAVAVHAQSSDIVITRDGTTAYIATSESGNGAVQPLSLVTRTLGLPLPVGGRVYGLAAAEKDLVGPQSPTIKLPRPAISGAIGDTTNPTVTIEVAQRAEDGSAIAPDSLAVTVVSSSNPAVIPTSGVDVTTTGATRTVSLTPTGVGYSTITFRVTGAEGKTATATLSYGATKGLWPGARWLLGNADLSTAIDVGDGYMLAADDERGNVGLYRSDVSGAPLKEWPLAAQSQISGEIDFEGAARNGDRIYWAGSMGNDKKGQVQPSRQTVLVTSVTGSGASTELTYLRAITNLRTDLIAWDNANGRPLRLEAASSGAPKADYGFNVEGLELAPGSTSTAYLGFRAPLDSGAPGGKALIVPVTNFDRLMEGTDTHGTFGEAFHLDLDGHGIRELRKNSSDEYLILAGGTGHGVIGGTQVLYQWDGNPAHAPVEIRTPLPTDSTVAFDDGPFAWEAIVSVPHPLANGAKVTLLGDQGYNQIYNDGTNAKSISEFFFKKSPMVELTVANAGTGPLLSASAPVFPAQAAGTVGRGQWVTVTNTGDEHLELGDVRIKAADRDSVGEFLLSGEDGCAGMSLAPQATCEVLVRHAPARENAISTANLVFEANVAGGEAHVALTATSTTLPQGPKGDDGAPGTPGEDGQDGGSGPKGDTGAPGADGDDGAPGGAGQTGPQGSTGAAGPQGPAGPAGPQGPAGRDGTVSFAATSAKATRVRRGRTATVSFTLRNGTTTALAASVATASAPKALRIGGKPTVRIAALRAGQQRAVRLRLKVGRAAKVGAHKITVTLKVGRETVAQTVVVRVTR